MNTNDSTSSSQKPTGSITGQSGSATTGTAAQNRTKSAGITGNSATGGNSMSTSTGSNADSSAKTQSSDKQWNQSPTKQSPESNETSGSTQYKEQASAGAKNSSASNSGSASESSQDSQSNSKNGQSSTSARNSSGDDQAEWISEMHQQATSLENRVETFIRERPMISAGAALGLGVGAFFLLRNASNSAANSEAPVGASISPVRSGQSSGFLSQNLVSSLGRIQKEFDKLATDGIGGVRHGVTELISKDMESQPIQTIATVLGLGFAVGNLNSDQLKRGAIRVVKLLAVRSLDEVGSKHKAIENQGDSRATN